MAILENIFSLIILTLPIRELYLLNLSIRKKAAIASMFALGGFVIITGVMRMAVLYRPHDQDFDLTKGDIWLNVHDGTAIISACLPTLRPLIEYFKPKKQQSSYYRDGSVAKRRQGASASPELLEGIYVGVTDGGHGHTEEAKYSEESIGMGDLQGREETPV